MRRSNPLVMLEIASGWVSICLRNKRSGYSTISPRNDGKAVMRYTSPPNQQAYYEQVWNLVRQIPSGKVAAYGQIALLIPPPMGVDFDSYKAFSPRWVGGAMAACPDDVPWQRVINSQGKISERAGAEKQRQLLEQEGVEFDAKDRVDLKKYGWKGPDEEDPVEPRQPNLF